jgi:hypothetical protein
MRDPTGLELTRGPNGDVFATDQTAAVGGRIARWKADGTYLGLQSIPGNGLTGIVWTGNTTIPEPVGVILLVNAMCVEFLFFRRSVFQQRRRGD